MIVIQNAKKYAIYCRTNRRVKWQYSKYAGCFDSIEEGIESIKTHLPGQSFQYLAQDMDTGEEIIGNVAP